MNSYLRNLACVVAASWLLAAGVCSAGAAEVLQPSYLRCENLVDPLGVGETAPRLGWILQSPRRGDRQSAYQILVASSKELLAKDQGDLWDSGKVVSDENAHVAYAGKPLTSRMNCFWKVRVWSVLDANGEPAAPAWSESAMWTVGLLSADDWHAKWIDSTTANESMATHHTLRVIHATYGAVKGGEPKDVTAIVKGLVKNGQLTVTVDNESLGGDPAKDQVKQLTLEYELDGSTKKIRLPEKKTFSKPADSERVWLLRKQFVAKGPVKQATMYVTALGLYEAHLNGQRVGDHTIAPDWTDYRKRIRYQAYDVTSIVKPGANALGAMVSVGWYAGHIGNGGYHEYGRIPALLEQLEVTYEDGSTDTITTDDSWQTHPSAILSSDFMLGENFDARELVAEWDEPTFKDDLQSPWAPVTVREVSARPLESQVSPPVRELITIHPVKLTEPAAKKWTYDLGQNMVGVVRLKVSAPAGTVVTIHHAEMLNPDGTVYTTNLRGAPSVDTYTCRGGGAEIWQPTFAFHGFRYVELTGLPNQPGLDAVTGIVLGTDTPRTGSFTCSDPRINQLMSNIQWGQRGNYLSVPTDCPQRDERLGWMGDAEVFVRTATCNADVEAFFTKWLVDVDDAQKQNGAFTDVSPERGSGSGTPAWGDAGVICPWTIYLAYGDKRLLEQNLPAMTKWVEWCRAHSSNLIRDRDRGGDYGDWLSIGADTPKDVIGTAYFAYSTHLVAMAYKAVGNEAEATKYLQLFEEIKAAFNKKYVAEDGRIHGNTQCCYAMAMKFDLLSDKLRFKAADYLVEDIKAKGYHLSTGFVGVSYLLPTLTQAGHVDVAYKLLFQDTFPSWLFSVKHGATTIWERWDGWTPEKGFQDAGMNSFNHYSLGSCGEWLYDSVAGIGWDAEQPGYKHIILRPAPGVGLTSAKASIGSPYGQISSGWTWGGGKLDLKVTIPANTTATLYLPAGAKAEITEGGKSMEAVEGVKFSHAEGTKKIYELQSGSYAFHVKE